MLRRLLPTRPLSRSFSAAPARRAAAPMGAPPPSAYEVFDKRAKRTQKSRAAAQAAQSRQVDYLRDEVARRMVERLAFVSRDFGAVLDLGAGSGALERVLCDPATPDGALVRSRLKHFTMLESSETALFRDADPQEFPFNTQLPLTRVVGDEETLQAPGAAPDSPPLFAPESFDAVLSSMSMHWINDLPGVLARVHNLLVPDGMFMAAMLGGDSLFELRTALQLAETERAGGVSPRLSPLADVRDMGSLLQRAKFNLLTVDVDDIVVAYPDTFALMADLQAMGDSNAVLARQTYIPRDVLLACDPIYRALHGSDDDGSIPATFRVIYLIGWKPSELQPKPLERGSAQVSLKDALPAYETKESKD